MGSFVGTLQQFISNILPWYMRGKNEGAFHEAIGLTYDSAVDTLAEGLKLGQPLRCDPTALPVLSKDRGIRLYPTEPEASKRDRLSQWWQLNRSRGTHQGEMRHEQPYFLPGALPRMRIVHQDGAGARATWHTLDPDGTYSVHKATPSNWNYGPVSDTAKWSRFWVIIYAPVGFLDMWSYDDGNEWDEGGAYDGILESQVALDLIAMILDWQSAHSLLKALIVTTEPTSFDPTSTYSAPDGTWTTLPIGNWFEIIGANGERTRPPYAHWIYEQ